MYAGFEKDSRSNVDSSIGSVTAQEYCLSSLSRESGHAVGTTIGLVSTLAPEEAALTMQGDGLAKRDRDDRCPEKGWTTATR